MKKAILILNIFRYILPFLWENGDVKHIRVSVFYCEDDKTYKKYLVLDKKIKKLADDKG